MQRVINSWKSNPIYIKVIRLWLGVTWIYGGWNKATDSGFLDASSAHYIGAQLKGYLGTSPIAPILRKMMEHSLQIGWLVMLSEFAIGIALILGIFMELSAFAGFGMAITLWLSATWSVKPYFLGSDTAYAILWLALFLYLMKNKKVSTLIPNLRNRREVLQLATVGGIAIATSFLGKVFQTANANPEMGTPIATLAEVPVGGSKLFKTANGTQAILFRTNAGVFAYSRVCTHQGCIVDYDTASNTLLCPCHGAQYDYTNNAKVINGPAPTPLPAIKVAIKGNNIVQV